MGFLAGLGMLLLGAAQEYAGFGQTGRSGGLFGIIDEVRFGGSYSLPENEPGGLLLNGQVLFTNLLPPLHSYLLNALLRPRPHLGATIATDDGTDQIFGGLTWTSPLFRMLFVEIGLGATVHNGPFDSPDDGPDLGCSPLFRESIAVGMDLPWSWRALAGADHSSHANLCEGGRALNDGLTHAGAYVGYRF
jgi:hypothetical protein